MRIPRGQATVITTAILTSSRAAAPLDLVTTSSAAAYSTEQLSLVNHLRQRRRVSVAKETSQNQYSFRSFQSKGFGFSSRQFSPTRLAKIGDGDEPSVYNGLPSPMRVHHLPSVGSTQDEARQILRSMRSPEQNGTALQRPKGIVWVCAFVSMFTHRLQLYGGLQF